MKVKEESENAVLKLNIQKTKIMASGPITSWQIDGETVETVTDFAAERRYPTPQARGEGQRLGGATAGLRSGVVVGGPTPRPRSSGCVGAGGPRGAIPR